MAQMSKGNLLLNLGCILLLAWLAGGCSAKTPKNPQQRYDAAKALFEQTTKQFHTPLADATGAEKDKLEREAAAGYEQLLKKYSDQDFWAAQALRNLAGIRATQGKVDQAVKLYASVEQKYPKQDWEILMAWKAAADLLWENRRPGRGKTLLSENRREVRQSGRPAGGQNRRPRLKAASGGPQPAR